MAGFESIGFIGLGVMGEPICRNLIKKSGTPIVAFDIAREPLQRIRADGANIATNVARGRRAGRARVLLPAERQARAGAVRGAGGLLESVARGPNLHRSRHLTGQADARARRTRSASKGAELRRCADRAHAGGRDRRNAQRDGRRNAESVREVEPLIRRFASEVTNCGAHRRRSGHKNYEQHGAVSDRQCACRKLTPLQSDSGVDPKAAV